MHFDRRCFGEETDHHARSFGHVHRLDTTSFELLIPSVDRWEVDHWGWLWSDQCHSTELVSGVKTSSILVLYSNRFSLFFRQTECSRAGHRGFVVMLEGLFISAGLMISAWLNFGMSHTKGSESWRFPLAFSCFFAIIVFFSMPLWPESVILHFPLLPKPSVPLLTKLSQATLADQTRPHRRSPPRPRRT